ncbi:Serine/threonine-protein kinase 16 [Quaeritorhiza haematococci]|nr:Serine/threonine-protein kinase 16 [Quaeritorhiza haematococci]
MSSGFQQLEIASDSTANRMPRFVVLLLDFVMALVSVVKTFIAKFTPPPVVKLNGRSYKRRHGMDGLTHQAARIPGFSFVYLVKPARPSSPSGRAERFALKRIRIQLPEQEERLRNEIASHKAVDSPHVLKLVDHQTVKKGDVTVEGLLLLPFYGGGTVQDLIDRTPIGDYIPLATILRITIDVCKGLLAFHARDPPLAFRDLKPANILLDEDGKAVLMDLGSVAPAHVRITSRREAIALQELCAETVTAPFRAPELFDPPSDILITEKTDVWALGCTTYAMAYRTSPFDGSMTAAVGGKVLFPSKADPYGPPFRAFIESILLTDPRPRPSVEQVLRKCEAMLMSITLEAGGV